MTRFASPAEESFSKLLDLLGIAWEYEPREFELEHNEKGKVIFAFRPDFYLPDRDLYIELTLARDMGRKNRQLRAMAEKHPDVKVVVLRRRDLLALHQPELLDSDGAV